MAHGPLALYLALLVAASSAGSGASVTALASARRMELFFGASAGVMLGVLAAHLLPEAFKVGPTAAWGVVAGFAFMLVVERFVLPHALHSPQSHEEHDACDPVVEHEHVRRDVAGVGAFVGLALHTLGDGLALGAAAGEPKVAPYVFLAIVAHHVPSSFAVGSLLVRAKVSRARVVAAGAVLGAMVAVGAGLYLVARALWRIDPRVAAPYAVAFSAGSFLHVVVTDLLPDLHRGGPVKRELLLAFVAGLAMIVALSIVVPG